MTLATASLLGADWCSAQEPEPAPATIPDPIALAEQLHREGEQKRKEGDWDAACPLYRRSQELEVSATTQGRIAQCLEREGLLLEALQAWHDAMSQLDTLSPERKRLVAEVLPQYATACEARIPRLRIALPETGSALTIELDERILGASALVESVRVNPGAHALSFEGAGRAAQLCTLQFAESQQIDVRVVVDGTGAPGCKLEASNSWTVTLAPLLQATVPPPVAPQGTLASPEPGNMYGVQRWTGLGLMGAGAVGLSVAGYFGIRTLYLVGKADCVSGDPDVCSPDGGQDMRDAGDNQKMGFVSLGVGAFLAGMGLTLVLMLPDEDAPLREPSVAVTARLTPGGVNIGGQW